MMGELLTALAAGLLTARALRVRRLHWSWPVCTLALAALVSGLARSGSRTLALTSLVALAAGARAHRRDLHGEPQLVRAAASRLGPADVLAAVLHRVRARHGGAVRRRVRGGALELGVDARLRGVSIPFGPDAGAVHTLVVGATGSGKTVTQTLIATGAIAYGMGAVVLDPKGDADLRGHLAGAAQAHDRAFIDWSPRGRWIYNPCARGGDTEVVDRLLGAERFTEPHYLRQAQRFLGHTVRALRAAGSQLSVAAIVEHLDPERLQALSGSLPAPRAASLRGYLDSMTVRQRNDLAGVRDRLATLAESDVGHVLDPRWSGGTPFELLDALRSRSVVYFDLEADRRPLLAQMLGAAVVQDLQSAIAALQSDPVPTIVVIDEFSALAAAHVVRLFARARSAGVSMLLGTQELADLRMPGEERLLEQVLGNLTTLLAHRQVVPASAELVASLAGSRQGWRLARHSDGRYTRSAIDAPRLEAQHVTRLARGHAAVLVLGARGGVRTARISPPGA